MPPNSSLVTWTREEDKAFESAIANLWNNDSEYEWNLISSLVPNKSIQELKKHLQLLIDDITDIEAGVIPIPKYNLQAAISPSPPMTDNYGNSGVGIESSGQSGRKRGSRVEQERRKGVAWSEEEHKLFLLGLAKFGKGDWRSISRNFVISRTPTQVASHAQKYFHRLNSTSRDRRRSSIHDITSVSNGQVSSHQAPITGQHSSNPSAARVVGPSAVSKHGNSPTMHGGGMYGAPAIGHPVGTHTGHMASAVGTPVMLPPGHHHPYVVPMSYPMPPPPPMHH